MVKHTQPIRRLLPTNCLCVFDYFVSLALEELNKYLSANRNLNARIVTSYVTYKLG